MGKIGQRPKDHIAAGNAGNVSNPPNIDVTVEGALVDPILEFDALVGFTDVSLIRRPGVVPRLAGATTGELLALSAPVEDESDRRYSTF